jgi:large subunit ribosomal protein L23
MSDIRLYDILKAPVVSEKSARLQEQHNQYVFEVARTASKTDVKAAVEKLFSVKVDDVTVVNIKGKRKSFRFQPGRRSDRRKAYVRLAEGQSIDLGAKA